MNKSKSKLTLLFFIVFSVLTYAACEKNQTSKEVTGSEKLIKEKEAAIAQKRQIVIEGNIATITTADGKVTKQSIKVPLSKQKLFLSKVGVKGDSLGTPILIALPPVSPPNFLLKSSTYKSNKLGVSSISSSESDSGEVPVFIFVAVCYLQSCQVTLMDSYLTSGQYSCTATVYNITCTGVAYRCIHYDVIYHWKKNGLSIGTSYDSFSRCA